MKKINAKTIIIVLLVLALLGSCSRRYDDSHGSHKSKSNDLGVTSIFTDDQIVEWEMNNDPWVNEDDYEIVDSNDEYVEYAVKDGAGNIVYSTKLYRDAYSTQMIRDLLNK